MFSPSKISSWTADGLGPFVKRMKQHGLIAGCSACEALPPVGNHLAHVTMSVTKLFHVLFKTLEFVFRHLQNPPAGSAPAIANPQDVGNFR